MESFKSNPTLQLDEIQAIINELLSDKDFQLCDEMYFAKQYEKLYQCITLSKNGNLTFLSALNQNRPELLNLHPQIFRIFSRIILSILDRLNSLEMKQLLQESNLFLLKLILILSQTFYKRKDQNAERCILSDVISYHSIWGSEEIWKKLIKSVIKYEIGRQKQNVKKNKKKIVLSVLITYKFTLVNFGLNDFVRIIYEIGNKYDINEKEISDV